MQTLLVLGATGLVGREVLALALADARLTQVIAPTRRALPAHPRLLNPVVDFEHLDAGADFWRVDAVIGALGTTIGDAGSQAAFKRVDQDYTLAVASLTRAQGARAFALTSAKGANPASPIFYSRIKGEVEAQLRALHFDSLTLVRPGLLDGDRVQQRPGEQFALRVSRALKAVLPPAWRAVPASAVARTLLEAALAGVPGVQVIESAQIAR